MLSPVQVQQIMAENESLELQLRELNAVLAQRENQIEELKKMVSAAAELQSRLDSKQYEIQDMQNRIGKQQQLTAGAAEREQELEQELSESIKLAHQYKDLLKQHTYLSTLLADVQEELVTVKKRNSMLQKIAVQVGELESMVENLTLERDRLIEKIRVLQKGEI
jgi:predicted  nucleic acid-binding Zn-ribbon protein